MKIYRIYIFPIASFLFGLNLLHANTWYVHPDSALNSIQAGLDSCSVGDTVLVAPGIYYESISWPLTDSICLNSELGHDITIIDGSNVNRVLAISGVSYAALKGFTLQNGYTFQSYGAGIYCHDLSGQFDIQDNMIMNNTAFNSRGGGISCRLVYVIMDNNVIQNNSSDAGGGIFFEFANGIIRNTAIMQNTVNDSGGGIFCGFYSNPEFINCVISENSLHGIFCHYWTSPTFDSCEILSNTGDGIQFNYLHDAYIHHCNIADNTGYGIWNFLDSIWVNAEENWWGDATGPFHPDSNPGGQGDSVSDYVDFIPWLSAPVGIQKKYYPQNKPGNSKLTCHPNPFASTTTIRISGAQAHKCTSAQGIQIYDISGCLIRLLVADDLCSGALVWDGRDALGREVQGGVYFLKLNSKPAGKVVKVR
jgi:hypothetical protein